LKLQTVVSEEENIQLLQSIVDDEIEEALFQMNPYKALVLEGFFKQNWEVVQPLPYESIKDFFASRRPPREINYTILPLFPKLAALKQRPNMNRSVCIIQYTRGSQKFSLMECILCDGGLSILFRVHSYHIGSFTIIYSLPIKL